MNYRLTNFNNKFFSFDPINKKYYFIDDYHEDNVIIQTTSIIDLNQDEGELDKSFETIKLYNSIANTFLRFQLIC